MGILTTEDALIARLKALLGAKVRTVESLPGDWDDEMLKRALRLVPGVLVVFAGGGGNNAGIVESQITGAWIVYTVTGHASGEAARRRGDALQVGAYELIHTIVPALHNWAPADGEVLSLSEVRNLYTGTIDRQGLAVYAITFNQLLYFDPSVDPELLTPFETFDAKYDVPPLTDALEHRDWLDGNLIDSRPDAEDLVTLPQT